jgi:hypothetical protein
MLVDKFLCVRKRKFVVTVNSNHNRKVYPNLGGPDSDRDQSTVSGR